MRVVSLIFGMALVLVSSAGRAEAQAAKNKVVTPKQAAKQAAKQAKGPVPAEQVEQLLKMTPAERGESSRYAPACEAAADPESAQYSGQLDSGGAREAVGPGEAAGEFAARTPSGR